MCVYTHNAYVESYKNQKSLKCLYGDIRNPGINQTDTIFIFQINV